MRFLHQLFRLAGLLYGLFIVGDMAFSFHFHYVGEDFLWLGFPPGLVPAGRAAMIVSGVSMMTVAVVALIPGLWERLRRPRRFGVWLQIGLLPGIALVSISCLHFYLYFVPRLPSAAPVPIGCFALLIMVMNLARMRMEFKSGQPVDSRERGGRFWLAHGAAFVLLAALLPLALLLTYGLTDFSRMHRRMGSLEPVTADCIIVFGAGVDANGTPSTALAERVGCSSNLFHRGLGRYLVMSGGTNAAGVSESRCMKRLAMSLGVPEERIILDEQGLDTFCSVMNARRLMKARGWRRSYSVSHFYHLLRIKMAARRIGVDTLTVPVKKNGLNRQVWYLIREVAALYYYFFLFDAKAGEMSAVAAL